MPRRRKAPDVAGGLAPAPYNPRLLTEEREALLARAMEVFGDLGGVVFNRRTGHTVGGHQRLKVIPPDAEIEVVREYGGGTSLGTVRVGFIHALGDTWAYREVDWPEEWEKLANIAANKHGGEFVLPAVRDILADVDTGEFDLQLSGFTEAELETLMAPIHYEPDPEADKAPREPKLVTCPDCGREFEAGTCFST